MTTALWITNGVLCVLVLGLVFLVFGTLRALGVLTWRLDQLQATMPRRIGRDGLPVGRLAPDFTLPDTHQREVTLHEYWGRKVLLVFTHAGCGPCQDIVPELNRLQDRGEHQVVAINNGAPGATAQWAAATGAQFPVLSQEQLQISKRYQVFATPFAFLIDEQGAVRSKGMIATRQHLSYVLSHTAQAEREPVLEPDTEVSSGAVVTAPRSTLSLS